MKNRIAFVLFGVICSALVWSNVFMVTVQHTQFNSSHFHALQSGGASAGNSGAPGEGRCTNCHAGTAQNGNGINQLDWGSDEEYVLGETYTITLSMNDASSKNGFQLVALDGNLTSSTSAGELAVTDALRTSLVNNFNASRKYLGHKAAGNTVSQWTFEWTAPTESVGPVTFYVATNKTNSNNSTSGDVIYLSQHVFNAPGATNSISEHEKIHQSLEMHYNQVIGELEVKFELDKSEFVSVSIHDLAGRILVVRELEKGFPGENVRHVPIQLNKSGVYLVNFFIGNKGYSEKISVTL